jgi:dTDP-4-dehydrorhamnose reductase
MKVLITGAKGQVGTELVRLAAEQGLDIDATDHNTLDITQTDQVMAYVKASRPDVVINAAAYTAVDKAEEESELAYKINADAVLNLANAVKDQHIPLLHISTDYVFDGSKRDQYIETDSVCPINVYGESKLRGEQLLKGSGANYINLRTSWVFGLKGNNFVKTMIRLAKERDEFGVIDDQFGGPTFATDIAKALLKIAKQTMNEGFDKWGTYHFSGLPHVTWWQFADFAIECALSKGMIHRKPKVNRLTTGQYPTPATRPQNSRMSCQHIKDVFGIEASRWEAGCWDLIHSLVEKE